MKPERLSPRAPEDRITGSGLHPRLMHEHVYEHVRNKWEQIEALTRERGESEPAP